MAYPIIMRENPRSAMCGIRAWQLSSRFFSAKPSALSPRLRVSILQNLTSRIRLLRGIFFESAEEEQDCGDADAGVGDIEGRPPAAA